MVRGSRLRGLDGLLLLAYEAASKIRVTEIDHTGDTGIEVVAESLPQLFETAARGMFDLLVNAKSVQTREELVIVVDSADLEDLMVRWLAEINFIHLTERLVLSEFEIADVGPRRLEATVRGEHIDPDRHEILTEIKAVTYHHLAVERRNEKEWFARIIFDL